MNGVKHYSEADLLGTWYTRPGESLPVMLHLAGCEACGARYEKLEKKMHALVACPHEHAHRRALLEACGAIAMALMVVWTLAWSFLL